MSYQAYHSVEHTHGDGYTSTTSTSIIIHELTDSEVSQLPSSLLEQPKNEQVYEIRDEDRLTEHDFYELESFLEDQEDTESEDESDIEYYWFPSLLRRSFIHFLDDNENNDSDEVMADEVVTEAEVDEEGWEDIEDDENKPSSYKPKNRAYHRKHHRSAKPKRSEQVPVEVIHIHFQ